MSNKEMKNFKKLNKVVNKAVEKLVYAAKSEPVDHEERIAVYGTKQGIIITRANSTDLLALSDQILPKSGYTTLYGDHVRNIKTSYFDGHDGTEIFSSIISRQDIKNKKSSTDYAKMQGLDLDDLAERSDDKYDNYIDKSAGRKEIVGSKIGEDIKEYMRSMNALNELLDSQHKENEKLEGDLKAATDKANRLSNETKELEGINESMKKALDEANARIEELKSELESYHNVSEAPATNVAEPASMYFLNSLNAIRRDDESVDTDTFIFKCLDKVREEGKTYRMNDLYRIVDGMYVGLSNDIFRSLGGLTSSPKSRTHTIYPRDAYALVIALAVPASYVGRFIDTLINDYRNKIFIPTHEKRIPKNFEEMLLGLPADVSRIQTRLFSRIEDIPSVCSEVITSVENMKKRVDYTISDRPISDSPIIDGFVIIPKNVNAYEFIRSNLVEIFLTTEPFDKAKWNVRNGFTDMHSRYDETLTVKDEIQRYIDAGYLPKETLASEDLHDYINVFSMECSCAYNAK